MLTHRAHLALWTGLLFATTVACSEKPKDDDDAPPNCGTLTNPDILQLRDVVPAPGSSVPNQDIVHGFTVVNAPGIFSSFTFVRQGQHTAGASSPDMLAFTYTLEGTDLRYEAAPVDWETAPAEIALAVAERYQAPDECVYAFPTPLFSYSVTEGGGGAGGGPNPAGGAGGAGGGPSPAGGAGAGPNPAGGAGGGGPQPPTGGSGGTPAPNPSGGGN